MPENLLTFWVLGFRGLDALNCLKNLLTSRWECRRPSPSPVARLAKSFGRPKVGLNVSNLRVWSLGFRGLGFRGLGV